MGKVLSGFTADTPTNIQLDAGVFLRNLEFTGTETVESLKTLILSAINDPTKKIGATSGGGSFSVVPEMRNVAEDLDGARMKIKGLMAVDNVEVKLSTTMKEITVENIQLAMGASTLKGTMVKPKFNLDTTDYIDNICWVGSMASDEGLLVIIMRNALNTAGLSFEFTDKGTGAIGVEFEPFVDLNNMEDIPVEFGII